MHDDAIANGPKGAKVQNRIYRVMARDCGRFAAQVTLLAGFSISVMAMLGHVGP